MKQKGAMQGLFLILAAGLAVKGVRAIRRGQAARRRPRWTEPSPPASWPKVSVIVPAWREGTTLPTCLAALRAVDYPSFEVIIVAGGPDDTLEIARRQSRADANITVLEQRPGGKSAAMNDAVKVAGGDVIAFLDADTRVTPHWLKAMVAPLQGDVMATTGNHCSIVNTRVTKREQMRNVIEYEIRGRVMLQGSGSFALRRETLAIVGDFPEGVYADDWDLTERLAIHGMVVAFCPRALVTTERPANLREWWTNELRWRRIHLRSLYRLRRELLSSPLPAARRLLPYLMAWTGLGLTAGAAAGMLMPVHSPWRRFEQKLALLFWLWSVSDQWLSVAEATAYTKTPEWLCVVPLAPIMTGGEWLSSCLATLTPGNAEVRYKGPRRGLPVTPAEESLRTSP